MANPVLHQNDDATSGSDLKRRKVESGKAVTNNNNTLSLEKEFKLKQFQSKPIEQNIDFITLKSALSLLQSNLAGLEKNICELSSFKKSIQESDSVKEIAGLINKNSNYLNEITYKGSCVKCPVINWSVNYGIEVEKLNDDECYEKINEEYEILKRDKLFNS